MDTIENCDLAQTIPTPGHADSNWTEFPAFTSNVASKPEEYGEVAAPVGLGESDGQAERNRRGKREREREEIERGEERER